MANIRMLVQVFPFFLLIGLEIILYISSKYYQITTLDICESSIITLSCLSYVWLKPCYEQSCRFKNKEKYIDLVMRTNFIGASVVSLIIITYSARYGKDIGLAYLINLVTVIFSIP